MGYKLYGLLVLLLAVCFSATAQVIRIPVVVHVVYNTPAQNISDAQILSQIQVLNEDFNRLNADTVLIPQPFKHLAVSTDIQFCLAGIDPSGNATTGITRTQTTVTSFTTDNRVKFTAQGGRNIWNPARYLNIWICNLSGTNGYATFPALSSNVDGVVLDYRVAGRAPANPFPGPFNRGRRGTHEVAHYLNLRDIYNGPVPCTPTVNADWLPQAGPNTGCPTFPHITCNNGPAGDMFMNFMDDTNDACKHLFTPWQRQHMRYAIHTMRPGLLNPMSCPTLAAPGLLHQSTGLVGQPVTFSYYSPLTPTSWSWTLPGATPGTSNAQNPVATYAAAGDYNATLTVTSSSGSQTYTCQGCIHVYNYQISGKAFSDIDQNGVFSSGDVAYPNFLVNVLPNQGATATDANGNYWFYTNQTALAVAAAPTPYHTASPASHTVSFTAPGQIIDNKNFALTPSPNQQDLAIIALPFRFRPQRGGSYYLYIKNKGTVPMSGSSELQYDNNLSYYNSSGPVTVAGGVVSLPFSDLHPWETRPLGRISFLLPAATTIDSLHSVARILPISGDLVPADNIMNLDHPTFSSYDPNDKTVSHQTLTPQQVAAAHPLTYTIRFQNTGNDTAFKVMLLDTLSNLLNTSTLEVLHASHPYTMQVNNERRIVEWHFDNILLPDSTTNEPASHGFVQYRIRPNTSLVLGNEILNQAHIYFDFNEAVATNTTLTTVSLVSGTTPDLPEPDAFYLYPNPATETITIERTAATTGPVQVSLYNTLGQVVQTRLFPADVQRHELSLQGLPTGLYLVKVQQGDLHQQMRLVKQ